MSDKHIPYFNFYPSDFMGGTRGLSAQQVGVYMMLLCKIYEDNGPVEFDSYKLSTYCGMRENTFIKIFDQLVRLDKLQHENGAVFNERAQTEISSRANTLKNNSKAGKVSAQKRQQKQQSNPTGVQRVFNHTDSDSDSDTDTDTVKKDIYTDQQELIPSEPAKPKAKRAAPKIPFPVDWVLPDDWRADAIERGMRPEVVDLEAKDFQSYHIEGGEKRPGWRRSWTTWVKNNTRDEAKNDTRNFNGAAQQFAGKNANMQSSLDAVDEAVARRLGH